LSKKGVRSVAAPQFALIIKFVGLVHAELSKVGWCCEIWVCVLSSEIAGAITEIDESEDVVNLS
jgi:hypothetical protein